MDATAKVTRCWYAGADAIGAKCVVNSFPGHFPQIPEKNLQELMYNNLVRIFGVEHVLKEGGHSPASSDVGDVSSIIPTLQARIGGASGNAHSDDYRIVDKDIAYLDAAKALALTVIDLLYDEAQEATKVVQEFQPVFTKDEYLKVWGRIGEQF